MTTKSLGRVHFWTGWLAFLFPTARRRSQLRRRSISGAVVVLGVAIAGVGLSGAAYAFVQGHASGSTNGSATPTAATFTVAAGTTTGLYPGGTADLKVSINNPYAQSLLITGVTAGTGSVAVTSGGVGCNTTGVALATPSGISPSTLIAGAGSTVITLSNAASMDATSDGGCQGATFSVPVKLTVKVG